MHKGILLAGAAFAAGVLPALPAQAVPVYALTDENDLISFDSAAPIDLLSGGAITGLGGQDLIGIDFRPTDGKLYGVGNFGGIFEINTTTFATSLVSTVNVSLSGSRYGIDFDPAGDLRIVSDLDQNLLVNISTGIAAVGGTLTYAPLQPGATGDNPSVTAAAYAGATLYDIDVRDGEDRLDTQTPPASGSLVVVGPLGVNVSSVNGFDIYHDGVNYVGVAALQQTIEGINKFYTINLLSGTASFVGDVGGGDLIDGIAVAPVPEPGALSVLGIATLGVLSRRRRQK
jgi:hypothetical protein